MFIQYVPVLARLTVATVVKNNNNYKIHKTLQIAFDDKSAFYSKFIKVPNKVGSNSMQIHHRHLYTPISE